MASLTTRINGQTQYSTGGAQSAWRKEMLDDLLSQMRERTLPEQAAPAQNAPKALLPGKGQYVDIYV